MIVADANIPCVQELFGEFGDIRRVGGREISPKDVQNADVVLVRSVTRVDAKLLANSTVRFVGSATIGTDHVDLEYLHKERIAFAYAPGSNADSVSDYVMAALLRLAIRKGERLRGKKVGIVGVGEIGGRLAERLPSFGSDVLLNDPPRQESENAGDCSRDFRPLGDVLQSADVVTLHVPLVLEGLHPTYHLIDESRLKQFKPGAWLINTSRGAVVDNDALARSLRDRRGPAGVVLDVWENEPEPNAELVSRADLATPHVAGYAYDAKIRGARMLYRALRDFLRHPFDQFETENTYEIPQNETFFDPCLGNSGRRVRIAAPDPLLPETEWHDMFVRSMYDIERDHTALRAIVRPEAVDGSRFAALRRDYPLRREFASHFVAEAMVPAERRLVVEQAFRVNLG